MRWARARLEDWLRDYYFDSLIDISSSGVQPYTFGEIQALAGISGDEVAAISFKDSRSAGSDRLRELIAARYGIYDPSRVIVANGSTEAQLLVLLAALSASDEVVVADPAYHSLVETVRAMGCRVTPWRLRPENGFRPDLDDLERLVHTRTKMIIVNFPHNPTGVTLTAEEQQRLIEIAARHDSLLFWDGAFEDLVFHGEALPPVARTYRNGMSFGTMSKSFGLPGLRVGWGVLPSSDFVTRAVSVRDYTTLALSPLIELVAERALENAEALITPRLSHAARNRDTVLAWLVQNPGLVRCQPSGSGVVMFVELPGVSDTEEFCHRLMKRRGVLLVPGECFGLPGYVRLGYGGEPDELRQGLDAVTAELVEVCRI